MDQPWWSALYRKGEPFKCPSCGKTLQAHGEGDGIDRDDQDLPICSRCGTGLD